MNTNDILTRKKILFRFLKEHNCYTEFCINFKNYRNNNKIINNVQQFDIDELILRKLTCQSNSEIDDAFWWRNTSQGHYHWHDINEEWIRLMNNM